MNPQLKHEFPWGQQSPDLLILTGSRMYGYATETSDYDWRGVVVEPPEYLLQRKRFDQVIRDHDADITIWGFQKFFHLLEIESPNVWELLFAPEENIIMCNDKMRLLLDNRKLFVSDKVLTPMMSFGHGELKAAFADPANVKWKRAAHAVRLAMQANSLAHHNCLEFPLNKSGWHLKYLSDIREGRVDQADIKKQIEWLNNDTASYKLGMPSKDQEAIDALYYSIVGDRISWFLRNK